MPPSQIRRGSQRPPEEDPAVASVEALLDEAAHHSGPPPSLRGKISARHALGFCACVTPYDAPNWLIYLLPDGALGWCRTPDGVELRDLVTARFIAGGHVAPDQVLRWLRGEADHPYGSGGGGDGHQDVLPAVRAALDQD